MGGAGYRANCLPGPREPFKRNTMNLAPVATEGAGRVLVSRSLTLFPAPWIPWAGGVVRLFYPLAHKKRTSFR